jgi:hypothetical protein
MAPWSEAGTHLTIPCPRSASHILPCPTPVTSWASVGDVAKAGTGVPSGAFGANTGWAAIFSSKLMETSSNSRQSSGGSSVITGRKYVPRAWPRAVSRVERSRCNAATSVSLLGTRIFAAERASTLSRHFSSTVSSEWARSSAARPAISSRNVPTSFSGAPGRPLTAIQDWVNAIQRNELEGAGKGLLRWLGNDFPQWQP